jgi:6,7-dimethyl-8-ribityllumazine synthase
MPKISLIVSLFNDPIPTRLLNGAIAACETLQDVQYDIHYVPGAFELPLAAQMSASQQSIDAVVCLGVVIRGDTTHYDYVCQETARGIMDVGLRTLKPIMFGVLTTENEEQAMVRSLPDETNKGYECVLGAMKMLSVKQAIQKV